MEFSVKRNTLFEGIQRTLGIVERKTTIPILNNVLIDARNDGIRITATDREICLASDYEASVSEPGMITVPAKKLHEMIREIDSDEINFHLRDNNWVDITCGKVAFKIPGISFEEFPEWGDGNDVSYLTVSRDVLIDMIGKTYFAISADDMRPTLSGVCFSVKEDTLEMVATDGHRLAIVSSAAGSQLAGEAIDGIIIPRKGVGEIRKLAENGPEKIEIGLSNRFLVVKTDNAVLRINLIDGEYPDHNRVIPKDEGVRVVIGKKQILNSLRRMSVMSSDRFSGVRIRMGEGKMFLDSTNPDVGEAHDEIDVSYSGGTFEIGYNVRYLIDAMEVVDGELLSFEMREGHGPGVVRATEGDGYMCIVMPIKLRKE